MKRQEEGRDRPHPFLKRFTQQELTDEACPTYKNLLLGRSQRIPSRQTLMQIADYLECSMESRNNLLLAARYLPESLELEGDAKKHELATQAAIIALRDNPICHVLLSLLSAEQITLIQQEVLSRQRLPRY
jgi:transcriptional regulator with XRE-family HTH domain